MNKATVRALTAATGGLSMFAGKALATGAPLTAQAWQVRVLVDGDPALNDPQAINGFARNWSLLPQGPSATAVGLTIQARVAIRANSSGQGTNNFGVNRVGGGGFTATFADPNFNGVANHFTLQRGATGEFNFNNVTNVRDAGGGVQNDPVSGTPIVGEPGDYRSGLSQGNTDPTNGTFNTAAGSLDGVLTNLVPSRSSAYDDRAGVNGDGSLGRATLDTNGNINGGDWATVYHMIYLPQADFTVNAVRNIVVTVHNMSCTYIFAVQASGTHTHFASASTTTSILTLPDFVFTFQVPTPGATALMGLAGLAATRRRRA